jgi:hypothetical protein
MRNLIRPLIYLPLEVGISVQTIVRESKDTSKRPFTQYFYYTNLSTSVATSVQVEQVPGQWQACAQYTVILNGIESAPLICFILFILVAHQVIERYLHRILTFFLIRAVNVSCSTGIGMVGRLVFIDRIQLTCTAVIILPFFLNFSVSRWLLPPCTHGK